MLEICNSRKYGTGIPLNITENTMDGKFEIVIIDTSSLLKWGFLNTTNDLLTIKITK